MRLPLLSIKEYIQLNIIVPVALSYILGAFLAYFLLPGARLLRKQIRGSMSATEELT